MSQEGGKAVAAAVVDQQRLSSKKKRSAKKKKRKISKHILQANKDHVSLQKARNSEKSVVPATASDLSLLNDVEETPNIKVTEVNNKTSTKKQGHNPQHTKDIQEAAGYLSNWKNHKQVWKFNKNTQSWLIRHMYETGKVCKSTWILLLEYLQGLKGEQAKARIVQEAKRRAMRYKKQQREQEQNKKEKGNKDNDDDQENDKETTETTKMVTFSTDTKEPAKMENNTKKRSKTEQEAMSNDDEEARWNALDDHDKRKEYKRARKILETFACETIPTRV